MAWTATKTWNPLLLDTAGFMNTYVRDNLLILKTFIDDSGGLKVQRWGVTYSGTTTAGTNSNSGAGDTALTSYTFTLGANEIGAGDSLYTQGQTLMANNANAKTLRLGINAQEKTILSSSAAVANNRGRFDMEVFWRSSTGASLHGWQSKNNGALAAIGNMGLENTTYSGLDWTSNQVVQLYAQGGASLDLTITEWTVQLRRGGGVSA